jgi:pimeloyl-ACP methyl ester carboxylesterase
VHVAGYGLGAWLAADLAVWCPERVASLSVIAPFGLRVPGEPVADVFLLDPATYGEHYFGGDPVPDDLVPGTGTPAQGGVEEWAQRYGEMGTAASLMWGRRYDLALERRLPQLAVPALVVDAEHDRVVPPAHAQRWTELLGARRVTVPGAAHALVVQQPERTADAVAQFVTEVHA